MSIKVQLSASLVLDAKSASEISGRSIPEQIEHWARLGKVAVENTDLPIHMLQDMFVSIEEVKAGNLNPYNFG